jgi:hypothetical protein
MVTERFFCILLYKAHYSFFQINSMWATFFYLYREHLSYPYWLINQNVKKTFIFPNQTPLYDYLILFWTEMCIATQNLLLSCCAQQLTWPCRCSDSIKMFRISLIRLYWTRIVVINPWGSFDLTVSNLWTLKCSSNSCTLWQCPQKKRCRCRNRHLYFWITQIEIDLELFMKTTRLCQLSFFPILKIMIGSIDLHQWP